MRITVEHVDINAQRPMVRQFVLMEHVVSAVVVLIIIPLQMVMVVNPIPLQTVGQVIRFVQMPRMDHPNARQKVFAVIIVMIQRITRICVAAPV